MESQTVTERRPLETDFAIVPVPLGCRYYPRERKQSTQQNSSDGKGVEYPRFAADATFKKTPKARDAAEEKLPKGGGEIQKPSSSAPITPVAATPRSGCASAKPGPSQAFTGCAAADAASAAFRFTLLLRAARSFRKLFASLYRRLRSLLSNIAFRKMR